MYHVLWYKNFKVPVHELLTTRNIVFLFDVVNMIFCSSVGWFITCTSFVTTLLLLCCQTQHLLLVAHRLTHPDMLTQQQQQLGVTSSLKNV